MQHPLARIGDVFEQRYRIEAEVGRGSMAVVFRATHVVTEQVVALKVMKQSVQGDDDPRARRFLQEIRATARLQHPNTVRVFDAGSSSNGLLWFAMEYVEGESLRHKMDREGRLSPARAMHIGRQIARALAEAHSKLLVHRDLKPENVLLTRLHDESDFVKVLDFGVAKFLSEQPEGESLTRAGDLLGTPLYLAPEQALERALDGRADLYSLGCILMEMMTGDPPFRASTPVAIVMRHIHDPAPRLSDRLSDVPRDLDDLVASMLEKAPERRPETVQRWLEAAERLPMLPDRPLSIRPRQQDTGSAPETATVLIEMARGLPGSGPVAPATEPPNAVPIAVRPGRPREETEEDVVFLSETRPETMILPVEPPSEVVAPSAPRGQGPTGSSRAASKVSGRSRPTPVAKRLVRFVVIVALLGIVGGGIWWGFFGASPSTPESSEPSPVPLSTVDPSAPPREEAASLPAPVPDHPVVPVPEAAPSGPSVSAPERPDTAPDEVFEVTLLTDPPGAEVLLDGVSRGQTPYRLAVRATDPMLRLTLKAQGHQDLSLTLLPRDLVSSGRRDLTWVLPKGARAAPSTTRAPPERRPTRESSPAAPIRSPKKPSLNWDE